MKKFIDMGNEIINLDKIKRIWKDEYRDARRIFNSKMVYRIIIDYYKDGIIIIDYIEDEKMRDEYYDKLKKLWWI